MAKTYKTLDQEYTVEDVLLLRKELIDFRDNYLKDNDFSWSVKLSHIIPLMYAIAEDMKKS